MKLASPGGADDASLTTLDLLADQIAVLDFTGKIVAVNEAWRAFAHANGCDPAYSFIGRNYLDVCERVSGTDAAYADKAAALIRHVIGGGKGGSVDYPCDAPAEKRWYKLRVSASPVQGRRNVVAAHEQIVEPALAERQQRLQANLLASVEQAIVATDLSGAIVFWNPYAERLFGWSSAEVLGRSIVDVTPTEENQPQAAEIMTRLKQGESWSGDFKVRHRSGRIFPVHVTDSPIRNERNELIGIIGISTDMTEQCKMEEALRFFGMVYQAIGEAIMVLDMAGRFVAINPAFTRLTGYTEAEIIGQCADILKSADAPGVFDDQSALLGMTGQWAGTVQTRRKSGEENQEWLRIDTIYDEHEQPTLRIGMFSHVTDQKRAKETIWQQANFDPLTGLPNRSMFRDRLTHELQKAERSGQRLALMFIDLDQFKEVNDTLGHDVGDMLLKQTAARLAACVRQADTVARLGGDEFTVILGELDGIANVERVARTIVNDLAQPFDVAKHTIHVSASVGITLYPEDGRDADMLIKNADQAMYASKNQGRDQFHFYTQRMHDVAQARMRMTNDLRGAMANRQFELLYQPIVRLASGAIHKAEALLRWRHPLRGVVNPVDFIPLAEQNGMIAAIGAWVYRQATEQARAWRETVDSQFQVSVNVSPVQLRSRSAGGTAQASRWADDCAFRVDQDAPAILEITEGMLLEANSAVLEQLQRLRARGTELAIDDFGTGYSALSYLRHFKVDYLKIDQSFVTSLCENTRNLTMCEAIIAMAHKLDIKVIAEGIENMQQRDLLLQAGCDFGQGFLFAQPLSPGDMGCLLHESASA